MTPEETKRLEDKKRRVTEQIARGLHFRRFSDQPNFRFYRHYIGHREQKFFPDNITPRSNIFFPYPYSNVESIVARVEDALFPDGSWFDVRPRGTADVKGADHMEQVLGYKLEKANAVAVLVDYVRSTCIFRKPAVKVDWDWGFDIVDYIEQVPVMQPVMQQAMHPELGVPMADENGQPAMEQAMHPETGQPLQQPVVDPTNPAQPLTYGRPAQKLVARNRPKLTWIDPCDLLEDPDGRFKGHIVEKTLQELESDAAMFAQKNPGKDLYYPESLQKLRLAASSSKDPDRITIRFAEIYDLIDNSVTCITVNDADGATWKDARYALRGSSSMTFQRELLKCEPIILWDGNNSFAHKMCPVLSTTYTKIPGEILGYSAVESIADLVDHLNKDVGLLEDNWNLGINARYAVNSDANFDRDQLMKANTPGGIIEMEGNPNDNIKPLEILKPQAGDYNMIALKKGMIESTGGLSDFYSKGVGSPSDNGTATGITSIITEGNYRFKHFIRNIGRDILRPMLSMCASMIQQYITDQEEMLITDEQSSIPKIVQLIPEQIVGSYDFIVNDENYAENKISRQRNMMAFANIVKDTPYVKQREGLVMLGKTMGITEASALLYTDQEVQQMQQQQQAMQMQQLEEERQWELHVLTVKAELACECNDKKVAAGSSSSSPSKPRGSNDGRGGGRPATRNFEGSPQGAGRTSPARLQAQGTGDNSLGLQGTGELGIGG